MKYFEFTPEEKAEMFDVISSHYYQKNFGQMSKSEVDLLMFHFYIEKMYASFSREKDGLDFSKCSDYRISKELGITQQRVRSLKIRNQLVYPIKFEWEKELAKLIRNARFDSKTGKVVLSIPDPNLYIEIQNFIEENGAYIEKQLNSKLLQLRAEYFIDLAISLEPEKSKKEIVRSMKKSFKDIGKDELIFDEHNIGKSLIEGAVNITSIVSDISSMVSKSNPIGCALFGLLNK